MEQYKKTILTKATGNENSACVRYVELLWGLEQTLK
jgi:hypothetical protein